MAALVGLALLILVSAIRYRRHQGHLARIGESRSMVPMDGDCPPAVLEKAARFAGRDRRVKLKDLLIGRGESANVFLAQRRVGRRAHHLLCFDLSGSARVEGFHVRPERAAKGKRHDLCLHWRAPRDHWGDERSLSMAARIMYNLASVEDSTGEVPLGLEVRGSRVWIHSHRPLRGKELDKFVEKAFRLRALLQKSVERTREMPRRTSGRRVVVPA